MTHSVASNGEESHGDELFAKLYDLLYEIAKARMSQQPSDHTLQPTALINEAYVRLCKKKGRSWNDHVHFLRSAAKTMRSVLVDYGRAKLRELKHAGVRVPEYVLEIEYESRAIDLLALDEALTNLGKKDPQLVELVGLRFFAGLTVDAAAKALGMSPRKAARGWKFARHWLFNQLKDDDDLPVPSTPGVAE